MRLIVFKQQMEKYALTSHYVVIGNSIGWKKEKPAIAELVRDSEKVLATALPSTNQISFEFLWFPPIYLSRSDLNSTSQPQLYSSGDLI